MERKLTFMSKGYSGQRYGLVTWVSTCPWKLDPKDWDLPPPPPVPVATEWVLYWWNVTPPPTPTPKVVLGTGPMLSSTPLPDVGTLPAIPPVVVARVHVGGTIKSVVLLSLYSYGLRPKSDSFRFHRESIKQLVGFKFPW